MPTVVATGCVVWSWLLLVQGPMEYLEWSTLLSGQMVLLRFWLTDHWLLLAVSAATTVVLLRADKDVEFDLTAYIAGALAIACLADRHEFVTSSLFVVYGLCLVIVSVLKPVLHRVTPAHQTVLAGLLMASMLGFFVRLAIPTQRLITPITPRDAMMFPGDVFSAYKTLLAIP